MMGQDGIFGGALRSKLGRTAGGSWALIAALIAAFSVGCAKAPPDLRPKEGWRVFAMEYGHSKEFSHSTIAADAPSREKVPFSWYAWLVLGKDRTILVDTGFQSQQVADRWKLDGFIRIPAIMRTAGVAPEDVTDLVLTHMHWDHAGNVSPYVNATAYLQRREHEWASAKVKDKAQAAGVRRKDLDKLSAFARAGRLKLVDGDREIAPGVTLRLGGRHTKATQWLQIETGSGTTVLASDNAYFYENLERLVPIGGCQDRDANLAELKRMLKTATRPALVVPGHDPRVARRFELVSEHMVEIR